MDCGRKAVILVLPVMFLLVNVMYFEVLHKFGGCGREKAALSALWEHDSRRHGSRMLASIDFQLCRDGPFYDAAYHAHQASK